MLSAATRDSGRHRLAALAPAAVVAVAMVVGSLLPRLSASFELRDLVLLLLGIALAGVAWLRPSLAIVVAVGAFMFSGLVRRVLPSADPVSDLAAIFPFIAAAPLAGYALPLQKPVAVTLLVVWATLSAAASFAVPLVGLAGWLNFVVPLLAAWGIRKVPSGLSTFARATVVFGSIAATYGILQYFVPFPWDLAWLEGVDLQSAGQFGEATFRPFGTLPAPTTAAIVSAVVILIMVFRRPLVGLSPVLRVWALSTSAVFLLLTQVRSVWLALVVGLIVGVLANKGRPARQLVPFVAVVMAFVLLAPQGDIIIGRVQTLTNLEADESYNERLGLVGQTAALLSPTGYGVGRLSAGSRVVENTTIDNGYLIVLGELGLIGAGLFLWVLVGLVRRARPSSYGFVVVLLVVNAAGFALSNLPGLLLWVFSGLSGHEDDAEAESPPETDMPSHAAASTIAGGGAISP